MRACGERFWPGPPVSTSHRMPWPKPSPRPRGEVRASTMGPLGLADGVPHRRWAARGPATPRALDEVGGQEPSADVTVPDDVVAFVVAPPSSPTTTAGSSSSHSWVAGPPQRSPRTSAARRGRPAADSTRPAGGSARCWRCQMADRLDEAVRSLERVPVPLAWDDVEAPCPDRRRRRPHRARADRALCGVVASWWPLPCVGGHGAARRGRRRRWGRRRRKPAHDEPLDGGAGRTLRRDADIDAHADDAAGDSIVPGPSSSHGPATPTAWSGEAGDGDGSGRADGWLFDPSTGATVDIPVALIAPRSEAGVWTCEELVVLRTGHGFWARVPDVRRGLRPGVGHLASPGRRPEGADPASGRRSGRARR